MVNLSLEISIPVQIGDLKHLYKSHLKLYLIVVMCLFLCEMHVKAVHGYV